MLASSSALRDHVDDPAVLHDVVPVGDGRGEAEVLLDQQDGEALAASARAMVRPICCTITGARPSVGSSSSSSCAPVRRMRPIASICCSPPDSLRALARAAARAGSGTARRSASTAMPPRLHHRRQQQVLLDAEAGEDAALLRAVARCPAARSGCDGRPISLARRRSGSSRVRRPTMPMIDLQRRGLAGAVAAEQRHHLARAHLEVHAVQDVRLAVPGVEVRATLRAGGAQRIGMPAPM